MNRNLKFRVWNGVEWLEANEFTLWDLQHPPKKYTFQQFTGLRDRYGKEIYEGDLLSFSYNQSVDSSAPNIIKWDDQEVYYDEALAGFYFGKSGFQMLDKIIPSTLEVTGHTFKVQTPDESLNEISEIAQKMGLY